MPPAVELFNILFRLRLDAIAFAVLAFGAAGYCRAYVKRRGAAQEFSHLTSVTVLVFAMVSALLADGITRFLGYPAAATITTVILARATVFGGAGLFGVVLLVAATRIALLRAQLRVHADTER